MWSWYRRRTGFGLANVFFFALGCFVGAFACDRAHGTEADYCRPYSLRFTQLLATYIRERAYSSCMNASGEPTLPANPLEALSIVQGPPLVTLGVVPSIDTAGVTIAEFSSVEDPAKPEKAQSQAWRARCARTFKSWDARTATVIPFGRHRKRVRCPCDAGVVCR